MRRFFLLVLNEFRLFRTALAVHLIAVFQPTLMYVLMALIMVVPTFDMYIVQPETQLGTKLISAMHEVGSPIGADYINPIILDQPADGYRQIIEITQINDSAAALQKYSYIDSNLVKNLRNRLTAALLVMWNHELGTQAVTIHEHPWLPEDIPYTVYFGMAMIPLAAYLAAAMTGGYLIAQEFENDTILEYRLSPTPYPILLAAKLTRLLLTGLAAATILYTALGLITGVWASSTLSICIVLLPLTWIAACIGMLAGLLTKSSLPSFLIGLASAFVFWLLGSGFGLAAGFSPLFETISRFIPNTPTIEMLFPYFYFGRQVAAHPTLAYFQLGIYCILGLISVTLMYRKHILAPKR
jgi:hypothetical protein